MDYKKTTSLLADLEEIALHAREGRSDPETIANRIDAAAEQLRAQIGIPKAPAPAAGGSLE